MKVFVAGGTGVIGRLAVPRLAERGHAVTVLTRSADKADALRSQGFDAVVGDVYACPAVDADVVVHLLTDLAGGLPTRGGTAGTDRLRRDGTRALLAAAPSARVVAESVAFAYAPAPGLRVEADPLWLDAPGPYAETYGAVADLERQVADRGGLTLRFGWLYGPGTFNAGSQAAQVRKRQLPVIGAGTGTWSWLHVSDAADAVVAAVDAPAAAGVLNVVDDDPTPMHEWLPAYATELGAKPPRRVPSWLARLAAGPTAVVAQGFGGASNAAAKRALRWTPAHPSWRGHLADGA